MTSLSGAILIAATIATGWEVGVFGLYAHTLMPALRRVDDRTFVAAFQAMDRAIINPWFMLTGFAGALVFTGAATALHLGRATLPWIIIALVAYAIAVVITVAVNVPLNDAIKAAGSADPASAREAFDEARWAAWNLVRVVLSAGAFVALCWALVVYDRT